MLFIAPSPRQRKPESCLGESTTLNPPTVIDRYVDLPVWVDDRVKFRGGES